MNELLAQRLRLRHWRDDDLPDLRRLDADDRYMRYLGAPGASEARLASMRADWETRGFGRWAVEERGTGRFVGHAGLGLHRLWPDDPELGYGLDPALWGRGYATEAAKAALEHAFASFDFSRAVSLIHPENESSIRVAERIGERRTATVWWPEGNLELLVYAIGRPR